MKWRLCTNRSYPPFVYTQIVHKFMALNRRALNAAQMAARSGRSLSAVGHSIRAMAMFMYCRTADQSREVQPLHSKREGVGFIQCITKRPAEAGLKILAPRVGLEPTTTRLTAAGSTIELSRNCQVAFGCLLASNEIYYTDGGNRCKPQFQNFLDFARCRF